MSDVHIIDIRTMTFSSYDVSPVKNQALHYETSFSEH